MSPKTKTKTKTKRKINPARQGLRAQTAQRRTSATRWWVAVSVYASLVTLVSLIPSGPGFPFSHADKLIHFCQYLVFAWLLLQAIRQSVSGQKQYPAHAWFIATGYGIFIELLQMLVPWRSSEWVDILANALGAAIGVWLGMYIPRRRKSFPESSHA